MSEPKTFKCDVCGYIHVGHEPPETCPICGVGPDMFSVVELVKTMEPKPKVTAWRCTICDYIHEGPNPPDECPVCGVGPELFEPVQEETSPAVTANSEGRIVIIGAGIAGMTAAEHARKTAPKADITVVTEEPGLPYYRLNLTRFLAGEVQEKQLVLQERHWFDENQIRLIEGEVSSIDRSSRDVRLADGQSLTFDTLILANGAHPFVPPIPGATKNGVMAFRTLVDARRMTELAHAGTQCVCIGGGLLGLETAGALAKKGAQVTVVEGFNWLLPRQLPQPAGQLLQRQLEEIGISVRCGIGVLEIVGEDAVSGVRLADGEDLPASLVIMATGVRANSHLGRQCELSVKSGIVVDDRMATSDANIFAAGDVTEHLGVVYGIWPTAYAQGVVAGINAVGGHAEFSGMPPSNSLKVIDTDVFSIGQFQPPDASFAVLEEETDGRYMRFVCRDGRLLGAVLFGDTSLAGTIKDAVEQKTQVLQLTQLTEAIPGLRDLCGPIQRDSE